MRVVRGIEAVRARRPLCLAVGVFDGVHLGHQAIIRAAVRDAPAGGGVPAALTFEPHPDSVLSPEGAPPLLTTTEEKLELFRSLGIRLAVIAAFDRALAATLAEDFVRLVAGRHLRACCLSIGEGWRFGAGGGGTPALLHEMAREFGFRVSVVPPVMEGGHRVSSTRIRTLLSRGRVSAASAALGRPYQISGPVVEGDGRGRRLGYPTANVLVPQEKLVPATGVYASWAGLRRPRPAAVNIGVRPTFGEAVERRVEVHILGAAGRPDLLGRVLRVRFVARLRGERRFPSAEALTRQMARDCARARRVLALHSPPDVI